MDSINTYGNHSTKEKNHPLEAIAQAHWFQKPSCKYLLVELKWQHREFRGGQSEIAIVTYL